MTARLQKIKDHLNMANESDINLCEPIPQTKNGHQELFFLTFLKDTTGTPNGIKISILLEELGLPYKVSVAKALA